MQQFSYYTVVRTSEPSIIADVLQREKDIDLQDIYGVPGVVPFDVWRKAQRLWRRASPQVVCGGIVGECWRVKGCAILDGEPKAAGHHVLGNRDDRQVGF